jgi:hypothetical protein
MKTYDVLSAVDNVRQKAASNPRGRANADFGLLNDYSLGLGRYSGLSPWERHRNGDELLYVVDGEVEITLLSDTLREDSAGGVSVLFASPPESGAERTRDDPRDSG